MPRMFFSSTRSVHILAWLCSPNSSSDKIILSQFQGFGIENSCSRLVKLSSEQRPNSQPALNFPQTGPKLSAKPVFPAPRNVRSAKVCTLDGTCTLLYRFLSLLRRRRRCFFAIVTCSVSVDTTYRSSLTLTFLYASFSILFLCDSACAGCLSAIDSACPTSRTPWTQLYVYHVYVHIYDCTSIYVLCYG